MNKDQLRDLIKRVLTDCDLYSIEAQELLMLTAAVESNLGEYIKQVGGPALGIFQMEPATAADLHEYLNRYRHDNLVHRLSQYFSGINNLSLGYRALEHNLVYSIIMARIQYLRVKESLPKAQWIHYDGDKKMPHPLWIEGMANYWKKYYNTMLGKGTVEKAIKAYNKYCV